jgi:hypothetical protein
MERAAIEEDDHETPVVDGASRRMTARAFRSQHGDDAGDSADESRCHMHRDNAEEYRRGRGDGDAEDDNAFIGHWESASQR